MTKYPEGTEISIEDFRKCGWQEAISSGNETEHVCHWTALSNAAREKVDQKQFSQGRVLWLLADVCSMMLEPDSVNAPYKPVARFGDSRSFIPSDLQEEEIEFLSEIVAEIAHPFLLSRVSDVLWLRVVPRNRDYALTAIDAFCEMEMSADNWFADGRECWDRAIQLCLQLRQGAGDRLERIEHVLFEAFMASDTADKFYPVQICRMMAKHGLKRSVSSQIVDKLKLLAESHWSKGDFRVSRAYYEEAIEWSLFQKDNDSSVEMKIKSAESYEMEAEQREKQGPHGNMAANSFYENALQKYREVPRAMREQYGVEEKIEKVRSKIIASGEASLQGMAGITTDPIDISDLVKDARKLVSGKDTVEALASFCQFHSLADAERLKENVIETQKEYPLQAMFASTHFSSDGRVIAKNPSIDLGADPDTKTVFANMIIDHHRNTGLVVTAMILPALEILVLEHRLSVSDFLDIARNSSLVPPGRELLFAMGLYQGYDGDFVTALHLLVPQIENMVRYHLKRHGVKTTNIDKDGIENENGLSTLIDCPEAKEIFGDNIVFEIKALLCSAFGPNLRNELAHGLLSYGQCRSLTSVYIWWMMLKLVVASSVMFSGADSQPEEDQEEADSEE